MLFKCLKIAVVTLSVILFGCLAWYAHDLAVTVTLNKVYRDVSLDLSKVLKDAILDKYTGLLSKSPTHVSANVYHINLMIKLRAEFLQAFRGLEGVSAALYNSSGTVMFTSKANLDDVAVDGTPLSSEQLSTLRKGVPVYEEVAYGFLSAIFPVMSSDDTPVFLRITKDCARMAYFFRRMYWIFIALPVTIGAIAYIGYALLVHRRNTKLLSKQYDDNLELREKKETAEKESVSKSQFLVNVSHELRTPLNSIIGFSELIQSEAMGPIGNDQYKDYIRDIHQAGVHLLSLINDVLDFSKAESSKLTVEHVKFDLGKVVDVCFKMMLPRAREAKVELKKEMPESPITVVADPKRMKQVIINVLSNSLKFTPENGLVKFFAEVRSDELIIEISDNGIGIARQDLHKVMSVFGQVESDHSRRYEGTGLGLPLSKKLVELMNGTFQIKSEPNLGTVITLVFPYGNQKNSGKEEVF